MKTLPDPVLEKRLSVFASVVSAFSIAVGLSGLAGWKFHVLALTTWGADPVTMKANTAFGFVLVGVSLWLLRKKGAPSVAWLRKAAGNSVAALAGLLGALSMMEGILRWNFGIDQLLVVAPPGLQADSPAPGLMSPITAGAFFLLSLALVGIDWRTGRGQWPAQFLSLAAGAGATLSLFAFAFDPGAYAAHISLALPTAVAFLAVSWGLICSRTEWGLGMVLSSPSLSGSIARRLLPATFIPALVGWLRWQIAAGGIYSEWNAVVLVSLIALALMIAIAVWAASAVGRYDVERQRIEQALDASEEQLDRLLKRIEEPRSEKRLRRRVEAGSVIAVLLTVFLGALSWRNTQRAAQEAAWVAHTHEVSTTLELTLRNLVDVEAGARGYVATGDKKFLEPYVWGRNAVAQDLQKLGLLILDPEQKRRLHLLAEQARARVEAANDLVASRQSTGLVPDEAPLLHGKQLMDAARATVEQMEAREEQLLERGSQRARSARRFANAAIALGSVLGAAFLAVAGFSVSREIGVSARARAQVTALNADLERRVADRTAALSESEGRLSNIIQSAMDAIITTDDQQRIVVFNAAAEKMFRCPAAEALGRPVTRFIPQRFHTAHEGHVKKFGENGATARAMGALGTLRGVRTDGEEFQIEASISHIKSGGKHLFTVVLRDITERVRAEAVREHLAAVVDSSDDAIISKDLNGVINGWNRGAEKIFGYTVAETLGKPMLMLFPPELVKEETDILARIGRGESVEHYETVRVRKDGGIIDVSVTISPIRDSSGTVVGASKIARDITERKQVEEALREKERLLSAAQRIAHVGSWALDLADPARRIGWSEELYRIYGVSPETFVPTVDSLTELVVPEDRAVMQTWIAACAAGEQPDEFEFRITWPDGSVRIISGRGELQRDASNRPANMAGSAQDITERKRTEAALRESQTNFAAVVNLAPQFVWICTNEGLNTYFNDRWYRYTGLTPELSYGKGWNTPFHPDDKQAAWDAWNVATTAGEPYTVESRLRAADGSYRWFLMRGEPVRDDAGGIVKWFGTCTDIDEMKRAQAELRESEERFQAMANGIPQLACMAEADGHIFWYNQRWYDYTGTTPEQMEGWGWQSVLDAAVLPSVLERWASAITSAEPFEMEFQLRRADGVFGTFLNRVMPLKDAAGRVTRWFGTNTDISERKQTELRLAAQAQELSASSQSLEAQTRVFKLVLDSMGEGLIAADGEGHFIIWNDAAKQQMGRDAADLPGEQWTGFYKVFLPDGVTPYPPESLPLLRALRGESVRVELMVEQPDHAEGVFLEVTARPMKDDAGRLCGGVAVLRDVTERKRAATVLARQAEELQLSRQDLETQTLMLRSVLDSIGEGLVAADETGKFILWNPAAARIVGLGGTNVPPGEWGSYYGTYLPDTITPFPMDQNPLVRAIRGEVCSAEIFIRNPELEHGVWIESNGAPLRAKNGMLRGGVVAFRDITQRKIDEREIRKLNEELEERVAQRTAQLEVANHELEAFTYSVSHDLRAPLRHIGGFSKILMEDFGPGMPLEAQSHLKRIEDGAQRMGLLVDELLNLARVGRHALQIQPTRLNSVIDEVVSLLQPDVEGRAVTWKIADLPLVECDPILIKQVFQNLIANALKFTRTRECAVIEISQRQENGETVIAVSDNGVGFNMKYKDKLFGVFQRLHRAEDFEGTGIGLATVQRIVRKHGGRIWADAELDKGATFSFTLGTAEKNEVRWEGVSADGQKAISQTAAS